MAKKKSGSKKPGSRGAAGRARPAKETTKRPPPQEPDEIVLSLDAMKDSADVHELTRSLGALLGLPAETTTNGPYTVTRLSVGDQPEPTPEPAGRSKRPSKTRPAK